MYFSTVALIGRHHDPHMDVPLREVAALLTQQQVKVIIEKETAQYTGVKDYHTGSYEQIGQLAELAIVLGGDGTMLGAARNLAPYGVHLLGINHGRLGFITDVPVQDSAKAIQHVLDGRFSVEKRALLEATIIRNKKVLCKGLALNDVVLSRCGRGGMIEVSAAYDGSHMYTQRSDGLIVATPTGATAYALSANGPLLHPTADAIVVVPIAPQTLSHRPIVLPSKGQLTLTLSDLSRTEGAAVVHFDMQLWSDVQEGDKITVRKAEHHAKFVHPAGYSYFSTLRKKLHWHMMPEESPL